MFSDHSPQPMSPSNSLKEQAITRKISELTPICLQILTPLSPTLYVYIYQKTVLKGCEYKGIA